MSIKAAFWPLGGGKEVDSYPLNHVVLDLRPLPEKGGTANINQRSQIKKGYFELTMAGGGSYSGY